LLSFFTKSCFEGLKVGPQISALKTTLKTEYFVLRVGLRALICTGYFGPSKSQILGPQTAFEGTVRDALN
jgi:hypothetical protein